jgi:hypothetical protein
LYSASGRALNAHVHFHRCVIDGVFAMAEDGQIRFAEAAALTPDDLAAVEQQVRARVLQWFARAGHLDSADARDMAGWGRRWGASRSCVVSPTQKVYEASYFTAATWQRENSIRCRCICGWMASPKREWLHADTIVVLKCVCNDLGASLPIHDED